MRPFPTPMSRTRFPGSRECGVRRSRFRARQLLLARTRPPQGVSPAELIPVFFIRNSLHEIQPSLVVR